MVCESFRLGHLFVSRNNRRLTEDKPIVAKVRKFTKVSHGNEEQASTVQIPLSVSVLMKGHGRQGSADRLPTAVTIEFENGSGADVRATTVAGWFKRLRYRRA